MRPTGRNTTRTGRPTARATSSSTWTRCGPTRTSTSSASTITCRCRDWRDGSPNIDSDPVAGPVHDLRQGLSRAQCRGRRGLRLVLRQRRRPGRRRPARRSSTRPMASIGCSARRTSAPGGRTPIARRPGGVRETRRDAPTLPQGKPIWFTEFGCPAVDKGPNQPNVFYDPKSSESSLPYFSLGSKDDPIQRAYLEAMLSLLARPRAGLDRLRRPDAVDRQHVRLGLGCAALSRISPASPRCGTTRRTTSSATG